jgi:hypothetical protein
MSEAGDRRSDALNDVPFATQVRTELWSSFVSLLRSYAAAATMDGKEYVVEGGSDQAAVGYLDRAYRFRFRAATGDGIWRSVQSGSESWGAFHLKQDGTLAFLDGTKSLDIAAIDFIESLQSKK